ncbi:antitoxin Xre/MbcA/ParS toxin-binding domain-containing protein [Pseudomonas sp. GG8]
MRSSHPAHWLPIAQNHNTLQSWVREIHLGNVYMTLHLPPTVPKQPAAPKKKKENKDPIEVVRPATTAETPESLISATVFWDSLGTGTAADSMLWISAIRAGLSVDFFHTLAMSLRLKPKALAALINLKTSALNRWTKVGHLNVCEGDKIYRTALIIRAALGLFGDDITSTLRWLKHPAMALDNRAPLDLFDTLVGLSTVEALIWRIENGVGN